MLSQDESDFGLGQVEEKDTTPYKLISCQSGTFFESVCLCVPVSKPIFQAKVDEVNDQDH